MNKGAFCISIDFELLWGRRDQSNIDFFKARIAKERSAIERILKLFNKYNIPATWATVGKIYEKGTPEYSGIDIIKTIKSFKNQEIGSHSYTHPEFTSISKEEARIEFRKFKKISFVFPRNKINYLGELKNAGFKIFRGKDQLAQELLIPRVPPVYSLTKENGVVNTRGSLYLVSGRGWRKFIPKRLRYIKCILGINSAIKNKKVFHLWFHPVDLVDDANKIFSDLEKILEYANKKREERLLEIKTMKELI